MPVKRREYVPEKAGMTTSANGAITTPRIAASLVGLGVGVFILAFVTLWGPVYASGDEGNLFLYPLVFALLPLIGVVAIVGIVLGAAGLSRSTLRSDRRWASAAIVGGALLLIIPGPALWFGNLPLVLFGS